MSVLPQRKLQRLKNYDYSSNGYYFITICTKNRKNILGEISTVGNAVLGVPQCIPSQIGEIIIEHWNKISEIDPNLYSDCFCLMPNHVHGIVIIKNQPNDSNNVKYRHCVGTERRGRRSLHDVIRGFKSVTTRIYNKTIINDYNGLWQKSYHDHIIRNEREYNKIFEYIQNNPLLWANDCYAQNKP